MRRTLGLGRYLPVLITCLVLVVTGLVSTESTDNATSLDGTSIPPAEVNAERDFQSQPDTIDSRDTRLIVKGGRTYFDSIPYTGTKLEISPAGFVVRSTPYVDGRINGLDESWYDEGRLKSQRSYVNGYRERVHTSWWESGQIKSVYEFEHDLHSGVALDWFRDGTLFKAFNYENGKESGKQHMFFEDGSLRANYVVRDGRRFGLIGSKPCAAETNEASS